MKKILFLSDGKSYLPEIEAYKKVFSEYICVDSRNETNINLCEYDLIWKFMGMDFGKIDRPIIHEYSSASVGMFPKVKNTIKFLLNSKPSVRIFLNEEVRKQFLFNDGVPCFYRDMGIDDIFFQLVDTEKTYDFVYVGEISEKRNIDIMLKKFANDLSEYSLLLIGKYETGLYEQYKNCNNIFFAGFIKYEEVPFWACKSKYALNYIPNKYPYYLQTSTKLLEYIALNLKIITTDYEWVNKFEQERKMQFLKTNLSLDNINDNYLKSFNFKNTDINDLRWRTVIEKSRIKEWIKDNI